jgi:hypothetical protein
MDFGIDITLRLRQSERPLDIIAGIQTGSVELQNGRAECCSNRDFGPRAAFCYYEYYKIRSKEESIEDPMARAYF